MGGYSSPGVKHKNVFSDPLMTCSKSVIPRHQPRSSLVVYKTNVVTDTSGSNVIQSVCKCLEHFWPGAQVAVPAGRGELIKIKHLSDILVGE